MSARFEGEFENAAHPHPIYLLHTLPHACIPAPLHDCTPSTPCSLPALLCLLSSPVTACSCTATGLVPHSSFLNFQPLATPACFLDRHGLAQRGTPSMSVTALPEATVQVLRKGTRAACALRRGWRSREAIAAAAETIAGQALEASPMRLQSNSASGPSSCAPSLQLPRSTQKRRLSATWPPPAGSSSIGIRRRLCDA